MNSAHVFSLVSTIATVQWLTLIAHLLVIPCLILTFMFGPCGYLIYQVILKLNSKK